MQGKPMIVCDAEGCTKRAVGAVLFHSHPNGAHVHDCSEHIAVLREFSDVRKVHDLEGPNRDRCPIRNCTYPETIYTVTPTELV